jgi:hypothetical protein
MVSRMMDCYRWLFLKEFSQSRAHFAWQLHNWMNWNTGILLYGVVMGAIALQHFPLTEPLAAGFFWINAASLVLGGAMWFYDVDFRGVIVKVAALLVAICVQAYLIAFHWETLCAIDGALKNLRTTIFGNHLVPGWIIGSSLTAITIFKCRSAKYIFHPIPRRPSWNVSR